jgi:uncharacterized membrane protein required for colicin V production
MHWLDSTILALLATAAVLGAYSGVVAQLFRLVGFGIALYAASVLHAPAGKWLAAWALQGADPRVADMVAYAVVFGVVFAAAFLLAGLAQRFIRAARLQPLNRGLGALLALGKMALVLGVVCYVLQKLPFEPAREVLDESAVAPQLARAVELVFHAVPEEQQSEWKGNLAEMKEALTPKR